MLDQTLKLHPYDESPREQQLSVEAQVQKSDIQTHAFKLSF